MFLAAMGGGMMLYRAAEFALKSRIVVASEAAAE
jgi:hypothetical protein